MLRGHCPGLAHDIEKILRAETDTSKTVSMITVETETEAVAVQPGESTTIPATALPLS